MRTSLQSILLILLLSSPGSVNAQQRQWGSYEHMDTLDRYFQYLTDSVMYSCNSEGIWERSEKCPVLVRMIDSNCSVLIESVACGDCAVGEYKEYYPSGNLKVHGFFRENTAAVSPDSIFLLNYCSVMTGTWVHFNQSGDTEYVEHWDQGIFVDQNPIQATGYMWGIKVSYGDTSLIQSGYLIHNAVIKVSQLSSLSVTPLYTNGNHQLKPKVELSLFRYWHEGMSNSENRLNYSKTLDFDQLEDYEFSELQDVLKNENLDHVSFRIGVTTSDIYGFEVVFKIER